MDEFLKSKPIQLFNLNWGVFLIYHAIFCSRFMLILGTVITIASSMSTISLQSGSHSMQAHPQKNTMLIIGSPIRTVLFQGSVWVVKNSGHSPTCDPTSFQSSPTVAPCLPPLILACSTSPMGPHKYHNQPGRKSGFWPGYKGTGPSANTVQRLMCFHTLPGSPFRRLFPSSYDDSGNCFIEQRAGEVVLPVV